MSDKVYLGDGVYASYDDWSVLLTANQPTTDKIFLEPEVIISLVEYLYNLMPTVVDDTIRKLQP